MAFPAGRSARLPAAGSHSHHGYRRILPSGAPVAWNQNLRDMRVIQMNGTVQRQLQSNLMLSVSYVRTRSITADHGLSVNQSIPGPARKVRGSRSIPSIRICRIASGYLATMARILTMPFRCRCASASRRG